MRADLHLHSTYSDGWYSPHEICCIAKARGLELISITDHDTLNGADEKRLAAQKHALAYLSGWEISAYDDGQKVHILGYGCKRESAYLEFTKKRKESALLRAEDSLQKLRFAGIEISMQDVLDLQADKSAPLHTMHLARAIAKRTGESEGETYLKYLAPGKMASSKIGRPTPEESIDCIHACHGIAVIAHPGRIDLPKNELESLIMRLIAYGLDGIESVYTTHTERETEYFSALARAKGVLVTGGSDTHVEDKTHRIGSPAFQASEALLKRLGL